MKNLRWTLSRVALLVALTSGISGCADTPVRNIFQDEPDPAMIYLPPKPGQTKPQLYIPLFWREFRMGCCLDDEEFVTEITLEFSTRSVGGGNREWIATNIESSQVRFSGQTQAQLISAGMTWLGSLDAPFTEDAEELLADALEADWMTANDAYATYGW